MTTQGHRFLPHTERLLADMEADPGGWDRGDLATVLQGLGMTEREPLPAGAELRRHRVHRDLSVVVWPEIPVHRASILHVLRIASTLRERLS